MSNLQRQIDIAKKQLQSIKKHQPYMLIQYSNLKHAEQHLKFALRKYEEALKEWEELGT